jgi:hypothetical protein
MVEFPAAGCWEVNGQYKGETLSFIVQVGNEPRAAQQ